jgi:hypothetical protein
VQDRCTKRLAIWAQWLDTTLLAPVPHRHVVLTIPKRFRAYCLYRRHLLGEIARVAARTRTSISSSPMAGSGPMARSCRGPRATPRA